MEGARLSPRRILRRPFEGALNYQIAVRCWLVSAHRVNRMGKDTHPRGGCAQVVVKGIGGNLQCVDAGQNGRVRVCILLSVKVRRLAGFQYHNERL